LQAHAQVPWRDIVGMRNRLIHGYVSVNPLTVWNTIVKDLPVLRGQIEDILSNGS